MTTSLVYTYSNQWSNLNIRPPSISIYYAYVLGLISNGDDVLVDIAGSFIPSRVLDICVGSNFSLAQLLVSIWVLESTLPEGDQVPNLEVVCYNNVIKQYGYHQGWCWTMLLYFIVTEFSQDIMPMHMEWLMHLILDLKYLPYSTHYKIW